MSSQPDATGVCGPDELEWLHRFLNCTVFGPPPSEIQRAHAIVDALAQRSETAPRDRHEMCATDGCELLIKRHVPKLNGPQDHATVIQRVVYLLRQAGHGDYGDAAKRIYEALSAPSATRRSAFSLRHLQANLPWTLPYSEHFEANAYPLDRVKHDVLHVMKSLGRIAAECENHDHGRDRKLIGDAFAKEVADLVICALHIAKLQDFDLQDAVVNNSEARNATSIPEEA